MGQKCRDLENQTVVHWSMYKKKRGHAPRNSLVCINPTEAVLTAAQTLFKLFIHRLPVLNDKDGTSIICIINHQKILRFIMGKMLDNRRLLEIPLRALDHRIMRIDRKCRKSDPLVD